MEAADQPEGPRHSLWPGRLTQVGNVESPRSPSSSRSPRGAPSAAFAGAWCRDASHRRLATAEHPLHEGDLRRALTAPGLGHPSHHLVNVLAAASPCRAAALAAGHLSTHRAFLLEGWFKQKTQLYPMGYSWVSLCARWRAIETARSAVGRRALTPTCWAGCELVPANECPCDALAASARLEGRPG